MSNSEHGPTGYGVTVISARCAGPRFHLQLALGRERIALGLTPDVGFPIGRRAAMPRQPRETSDLSKLAFQTSLIWTAADQSVPFVRAGDAARGPKSAALSRAWGLFAPCKAPSANLDSRWLRRESNSLMAAMMIEIKGLNSSK